jgi:putative glycosyltransferase (TIGR04372 family)
LRGSCLYQGFGRFCEAISQWTSANEIGTEEARRIPVKHFRVLDDAWTRHIGDTAMLDYVIKLGILEGRKLEETILYLPPGRRVANRFLLQQLAAHLRLVEHPADLPFDASIVQAMHYDLLGPRLSDGTTAYVWEVAGKTYERWHKEARGPLLTFPNEVDARGWAVLHRAGVPRGAWFVALHVRQGKWDGRDPGMRGILNADIAAYFAAIAEITRRGGWVIRMGDPGMKPLPALPNVIDYCHSDFRADWMDIFITARCRFMLGTSSGPAYVSGVYGVPSVLTNWWPPAQRPWHATDLFIPKKLRRLTSGQYLTLSETLSEPFSYCHSRAYLAERLGVGVEDNDPEEICAAAEEMLARLDGSVDLDSEVPNLRAGADRIYKSHSAFGMGQLAGDFVRRHGELIGDFGNAASSCRDLDPAGPSVRGHPL